MKSKYIEMNFIINIHFCATPLLKKINLKICQTMGYRQDGTDQFSDNFIANTFLRLNLLLNQYHISID